MPGSASGRDAGPLSRSVTKRLVAGAGQAAAGLCLEAGDGARAAELLIRAGALDRAAPLVAAAAAAPLHAAFARACQGAGAA